MAGKMMDPVCKIEVDADEARTKGLVFTHGGQEYFFSSSDCCRRFRENPESYTQK